MAATFELKRAKNGQFFFNLLASNGEVILTSEMYTTKSSAKKGIASVQTNAARADRYDRRKDKRGRSYFVLKAGNHQIIGRSESYSSPAAMEKGIKSVTKTGTTSRIRFVSVAGR